jgi:hypothetical protein
MPALPYNLGQLLVKGIPESNVANHAPLEEGKWPDALGAINDLVWDDKIARLDLLLERTNGREGDDGAHANVSQRSNVGSVLDLMGRKLVVEAVTRQEGNGDRLAGGGGGVLEDADG